MKKPRKKGPPKKIYFRCDDDGSINAWAGRRKYRGPRDHIQHWGNAGEVFEFRLVEPKKKGAVRK